MSPRALFPLSGGPITIDSRHPSAQVAILISFDNAPTSFSQFNQTSTGVAYPLLMPYGTITGLGEVSFVVFLSGFFFRISKAWREDQELILFLCDALLCEVVLPC